MGSSKLCAPAADASAAVHEQHRTPLFNDSRFGAQQKLIMNITCKHAEHCESTSIAFQCASECVCKCVQACYGAHKCTRSRESERGVDAHLYMCVRRKGTERGRRRSLGSCNQRCTVYSLQLKATSGSSLLLCTQCHDHTCSCYAISIDAAQLVWDWRTTQPLQNACSMQCQQHTARRPPAPCLVLESVAHKHGFSGCSALMRPCKEDSF